MRRLILHHFYMASICKACVLTLSTGCGEKNDAKLSAVCIRRKIYAETLPNARPELLPEAEARYERTLEAVSSKPLILIEAPSSTSRRGMLGVGKSHEEETSCDVTPNSTKRMVGSISMRAACTCVS